MFASLVTVHSLATLTEIHVTLLICAIIQSANPMAAACMYLLDLYLQKSMHMQDKSKM